MQEFIKQLDKNTCRNDIIDWLKSLDKKMLYRVFCIEGQTWLVATLLKMFWKLQENQNYHFALSINNHMHNTDTKNLIKQMPIALPLENTFDVKIPVKKKVYIKNNSPINEREAEILLLKHVRICGIEDIFDSITFITEK